MRSTRIATKRGKVRQASELEDLLNLGAVSVAWLKAARIRTPGELRALGAVAAFRRVAMHRGGAGVTYNLLYALEGALRGVRWDRLPVALREELKQAADAPPA